MSSLLDKLRSELHELMNPELSAKCRSVEWRLKKLPMWGQKVPLDVVNFEWPSLEQFKSIPNDAKLSEIVLMSDGTDLTAVKVKLSSGQASPMFGRTVHRRNVGTIRFQKNDRVSKVACAVHINHPDWLRSFQFLDQQGKVLSEYGHQSQISPYKTIQLAEHEELIGIYGMKDVKDHITSFGFIVKSDTMRLTK